jgi:thiol:disulfide interchange protein DsbD
VRVMNVFRPHRVGALLALVGLVLVAVDASPQNFVVTSSVEPSSVAAGETLDLNVTFKLAEGVHLYKDKLAFSWEKLDGVTPGKLKLPPAGTIPDPLDETGRSVTEVYEKAVTVSVPLIVTGEPGSVATVRGVVKYQGCTDTVCFRPMEEVLSFDIAVKEAAGVTRVQGTPPSPSAGRTEAPAPTPQQPQQTQAMSAKEFVLRLLMAFGIGIVISLTPCVYPMIPITAAIVGGRQQAGGSTLATAVARSVVYVLGLAIVYATLGVLSASLGGAFSRWLKTAWVLVPVAAIFVLLALSMFEVITIQMPGFVTKRVTGKRSGKSVSDVFVLGLVAGIVATPCIAAPIAGVLTFIATTGSRLLGFCMLFTLAWGMGVVLIVVGTLSSSALPKAGPWTLWIKKLFGFVMLWAAAYFLQPVIGVVPYRLISAIVIVAAVVFLGGLDTLSETSGFGDRLKRTVGILGLIFAAFLLIDSVATLTGNELDGSSRDVSAVRGTPFQLADSAKLEEALASGQPTVVEVYAEWCVICKKLDKRTLSLPSVATALSGTNALKVDIDRNSELQSKYSIIGPPTLMFFGADGVERSSLRLSGAVAPEKVLEAIDKIVSAT